MSSRKDVGHPQGLGGAIGSGNGRVYLIDATLFANKAEGGIGGPKSSSPNAGKGGSAAAGAVYGNNTLITLRNCTVTSNLVVAGIGGATAAGTNALPGAAATGGITQTNGALNLQNTIASANAAGDVDGTFAGDHNFIGGDPRLGLLAANGGPTLTVTLMPDSPAIDAADAATSPPTDQRGALRPYGSAPDIGAYEWNATSFYTSFYVRPPVWTGFLPGVLVVGPTNQSFRLQTSTNLAQWTDVSTNVTDSRGLRMVNDASAVTVEARFYRSVSP